MGTGSERSSTRTAVVLSGLLGAALVTALVGVGAAVAQPAATRVSAPLQSAAAEPVPAPQPTGGPVAPASGNRAPVAVPAGSSVYDIHAGDTLSRISRNVGISVEKLASANGIADLNLIYAGSSLRVPRH